VEAISLASVIRVHCKARSFEKGLAFCVTVFGVCDCADYASVVQGDHYFLEDKLNSRKAGRSFAKAFCAEFRNFVQFSTLGFAHGHLN